jgi:signal transduction histidine kinase
MKIRTRLTVWYAVILIVSLTIIGAGTYREIAEQMRHDHRPHLWQHAIHETGEMVFDVGLPAILLGLLGGWWMTRRALAPVTNLTNAVEKVHEGNLRGQIPRTGNGDELDRLTEVFNAMTARLDDSFQRVREFSLHASHELKTPLTVMRGELEMALREEDLSHSQRERLLSEIAEIERLAKIVDGLTLLTKADAGQVQLDFKPVKLDELVRESFEDAEILAQPQNIKIVLETCEAATVSGDRHRLRQLLLNLMDNAVKYNQPAGTVNVSLRTAADRTELKIQNTGPGIASELQSRVFERFFRGDTSHNNAVDGCGLGLSIAQWIVTAHGGEIHFASTPNQLTTVIVKLKRSNA